MRSSIMWQYIAQEQDALTQQMRFAQTDQLAQEKGDKLRAIYFVAHGSSFNAAVCAAGFFSKMAHIRAYAYTPGNFYTGGYAIAQENPASTLVAVISQTGTSAGALQALDYAQSLGYQTLGITAAADSSVAKKANDVLHLLCQEEISNAKTKGYSTTLLLLLLLAISLGGQNGALGAPEKKACLDELDGMIQKLPMVYEQTIEFCERTSFGSGIHNLYVMGSGMNFGTAQECQLKLMETMCMPTMFNDIGELSHGMHRSIDADSSILLIRAKDCMESQIKHAYEYLRGISGHVWMIDASGDHQSDKNCLGIPVFENTQSLLLTTLAVQVLSVYAPEKNGLDPNRDAHDDFPRLAGTRV